MNRGRKDTPLSIMYVEDDPVTRTLVAQTLPKKFPEYQIRTAENGKLGLELYKEYQPEIVITDVNMPIMNGILMAAEIKAINPDVVIIAVTAYSETNYLLNAIEIGISHYVLKPIDYRKLFEAIEKSSAGIRLRKELAAQNNLISELNAALENTVLDMRREQECLCSSVCCNVVASMATIREYGNLVRQPARSPAGEPELHTIGAILDEAARVERMIRRVHRFTHLCSVPFSRTSVNLSGLAETIAQNLQRQESQRRVVFHIADDVTVRGDERLLEVVLENLLENAWKYTRKTRDAVIEFGSSGSADARSCFVRDNGIGFDARTVQELISFQREETGEQAAGIGLGLATVSRIIDLHGGTLKVAGEPGKGAMFMFSV